jgi:hypothetical protein
MSAAPTPPCEQYSPQVTQLIITAFLGAYNSGAPEITDQFIAPVPEFQWYGVPGRQFPDDAASTDRGSLPAYFAAQHTRGDRLELKDFSYNSVSYDQALNGAAVNFGYTLIHTFGGGSPHAAPGKGALACDSGKIAVWRIESW